MDFQKSAKTTTTRSFQYYSYESMTLQLGPSLSPNCCLRSLTGFEKGSSSGPSASCRQGRSPVEVSGSRASFGQQAPIEGRSSNEGSMRRPGHEQQRLHSVASGDGELDSEGDWGRSTASSAWHDEGGRVSF
jgi:hypothetical protein